MLTLSGNAILPGWQSCSRRSPTLFERKHWRGVPATPCMCRLHSGLGTPCHILKGQAAEISCGPSFTDSRTSSRVLCRRPPMAPISSDRSLAWHSARALARRLGLCSTPAGHSGLRLLIEWMLRKSDLKLLQIWIPKEAIGSSDLQAVEDLANRSLTVNELVDFYGQLGAGGRAMPLPGGKDRKILGAARKREFTGEIPRLDFQ